MTWNATRDWCMQKEMGLPMIKIKSEMEEVTKELINRGFSKIISKFKEMRKFKHSALLDDHGVWMDASDMGQKSGQFYWADGMQVDNSTWLKGNPDHFGPGKQSCVYIHSGNKNIALADWQCSGTSYTLCEVPAPLRSCV
jgi:hypothetical protein